MENNNRKRNEAILVATTIFAAFASVALFLFGWNLDQFDFRYDRLLTFRIFIFLGIGLIWTVLGYFWSQA